jgi:hypothetical protein
VTVDDRGQIILLAALAVCVCLITLTMYLITIGDAMTMEETEPCNEIMENLIWAQEIGFRDTAGITGSYPWERRMDMVKDFEDRNDRLLSDIALDMLSQGMAYSIEYNDTLAAEYVAGSHDPALASAGAVLIKKSGSLAEACGCAYDVSMADGSAQYRLSRVARWS